MKKEIKVETGKMYIRPYMSTSSDMGLSKYNMSVFDKCYQEEDMTCLEVNGQSKYLNGLDEFSVEVQSIKDDEKRAAVIKEIRNCVVKIERELGSNVIRDPEAENFWDLVKICKPDNDKFFSNISVKCGNEPVELDPSNNVNDLVIVRAIEAGGFSMVARNLKEAEESNEMKLFYLDKPSETERTINKGKKRRNENIKRLEELYNNDYDRLLLIANVLIGGGLMFDTTTPKEKVYNYLDEIITRPVKDGKSYIDFSDVYDMSVEEMMIIIAIEKGVRTGKIRRSKGKGIIHIPTNTLIGRNKSEAIEFLKNPLNSDLLTEIM